MIGAFAARADAGYQPRAERTGSVSLDDTVGRPTDAAEPIRDDDRPTDRLPVQHMSNGSAGAPASTGGGPNAVQVVGTWTAFVLPLPPSAGGPLPATDDCDAVPATSYLFRPPRVA
jgi:hypothetical protein